MEDLALEKERPGGGQNPQHGAAIATLAGLAAAWVSLVWLFSGRSPGSSVFWVLSICAVVLCGAGTLLSKDRLPATIRWIGIAGFGFAVAVSVFGTVLLIRA